MRTSTGCWTCRLRRKKCDEKLPVCGACDALQITCHFNEKPAWMDGGIRQEEMIKNFKRLIKEKANQRREERPAHSSSRASKDGATRTSLSGEESSLLSPKTSHQALVVPCKTLSNPTNPQEDLMRVTSDSTVFQPRYGPGESKVERDIAAGWYNTNLVMFYLDHLLPFLLPFYRPHLAQGGRAWIFQLTVSSPVVREATLCLSSYFFALTRGRTGHEAVSDEVLKQTGDSLRVLRSALQYIDRCDIMEHLGGAVRIMASIVQIQCYELAILSFDGWQAHLNAAMAIFMQILNTAVGEDDYAAKFDAVMAKLGEPKGLTGPSQPAAELATAEQGALRFSSAIIMFVDIIASTIFQERPRLYNYHESLLGDSEDSDGTRVDIEAVLGIKNWILQSIGEISSLDAWKQHRKSMGNLDVVELVRRASTIRELLVSCLVRAETEQQSTSTEESNSLEIFAISSEHNLVMSRIWTHAALIYLSIVVSGWQIAGPDLRFNVNRIIDLLECPRSIAVLRSTVWPLCVAGCLAENSQENRFRDLVHAMQPSSAFGTAHKALEIMEAVWLRRNTNAAPFDLASCFRSINENVLLV